MQIQEEDESDEDENAGMLEMYIQGSKRESTVDKNSDIDNQSSQLNTSALYKKAKKTKKHQFFSFNQED